MKKLLIVLLMLFQVNLVLAETFSLKNVKDEFNEETDGNYMVADIKSQYNDCSLYIVKTGEGLYDSKMLIIDNGNVSFSTMTVVKIKVGDTVLDDDFLSVNIYDDDRHTAYINMTSEQYKLLIDKMMNEKDIFLKIYIKPLVQNSILLSIDNYNFKDMYNKLK